MKRRTSTAPIRIYSYGCRLPVANGDLLERQLLLAHHYYNTLIEIERRRRAKVREAQSTSSAEVSRLETLLEVLSDAIEEGFEAIRSKKGAARTSKVELEAERVALAALRAKRRECLEDLRLAKVAARTPELLARFEALGELAKEEVRRARATCGVYWGTYLLVEQAVQAACKSKEDPEFHRWNGCGRAGVQFQGGLPASGLFANDLRLQIQMTPTGSKRGATMASCLFRIGSTEKGEPVWVELPFRLHRPLPADGVVKWAWISKSMKGRWVNWDLQIVVEAESFAKPARPPSDGGVVAIDIGWRRRPEEDETNLRVGYWVDDQGRRGELRLPSEIHAKLKHAESIRSIEDRNFDAVRARLVAALPGLPEDLQRELKFLELWKAPRKLGAVVDRWKKRRTEAPAVGDEGTLPLFEELAAWWKQHRHLYDWESCERDRTLGARKMFYQRWAADQTKRYAVVVLEDFDLSEVAKLQVPDSSKKNLPRGARRNRTVAACSELVSAIKNAAPGNGCTVVLVPCADTTATCSNCGNVERFDHRPLTHVCERCGGESGAVDQDRNAAENLLGIIYLTPLAV